MVGGATEEELLKWSNSRVSEENQINSFKD